MFNNFPKNETEIVWTHLQTGQVRRCIVACISLGKLNWREKSARRDEDTDVDVSRKNGKSLNSR